MQASYIMVVFSIAYLLSTSLAAAVDFRELSVGDTVVVTAAKGIELHYFDESTLARDPLLQTIPCPSCVPIRSGERFVITRKIEPPCYEVSETNSRCEYNLVVTAASEQFPIRATALAINALSLEGGTDAVGSASPAGKKLPSLDKWLPQKPEDQIKACRRSLEDIRTAAQSLDSVTKNNLDLNTGVREILDMTETTLNMIRSAKTATNQ